MKFFWSKYLAFKYYLWFRVSKEREKTKFGITAKFKLVCQSIFCSFLHIFVFFSFVLWYLSKIIKFIQINHNDWFPVKITLEIYRIWLNRSQSVHCISHENLQNTRKVILTMRSSAETRIIVLITKNSDGGFH